MNKTSAILQSLGFGLMGYFFAAYYKKAFGKYLNPEENS
jgi:signal transduction histidine kinase